MRGRFPPDLLVVVLAPLVVAAIALGLGSIIVRAAQLRSSVVPFAVAATTVGLLAIVAVVVWLRRRRRS